MILLVVLGMLTFFSILVATYLVFANQSRQASFVIASRNNRMPDVRALMDDALMTLIRGTDDPTDPFYGEDLLSDYYGRFDAFDLEIVTPTGVQVFLGQDVAAFVVRAIPNPAAMVGGYDDLYTDRVITFENGNTSLAGRSLRVLRSRINANAGNHTLFIELPTDLRTSGTLSQSQVEALFPIGARVRMNGVPRNSPGLGFFSAAIAITPPVTTPPTPTLPPQGGPPTFNVDLRSTHQLDTYYSSLRVDPVSHADVTNPVLLPMALQPNHLRTFPSVMTKVHVNQSTRLPLPQGDFDEAYDAADFGNWFLSYRDQDGKITPSFHRPAVINYILNQPQIATALANNDPRVRMQPLVSLSRATFRPLPFLPGGVHPSRDVNSGFTGGNPNYALRSPIVLTNDTAANTFRLDQLAKALIGTPTVPNPWDVDNDGDGVPDSVWVDLGLPVITSREGKLLKPLVAPMIEDLSARLNVNAHGNFELSDNPTVGGTTGRALWAAPTALGTFNNVGPATHQLFRGLGYGPAEIVIPPVNNSLAVTGLEAARHQYGARTDQTPPSLGMPGRDGLDLIRTGWRPPLHGALVGYGHSLDPYGRAAVGLGRGGHLVMANSGLLAMGGVANEALETPYESDPSGRLAGDRPFTFQELEPLLRSNSFDVELLPERLQGRLRGLIDVDPDFARVLTTLSKSDDSLALPNLNSQNQPQFIREIARLRAGLGVFNDTIAKQIVAPEFRMGRKLDVNRPFGNGVDDNGNRVIDEPSEVIAETQAFRVDPATGQTVPAEYQGVDPDYGFGTGMNGRELLARHLYVLMLALLGDNPNAAEFPGFDSATPIPPADRRLYVARRVAQWAVNVVDYRDPDAIMTRFVFDENPFDGWNPLDPVPPTHVVWGVEQPELLFSESLALHDVRVRDTDRDGGQGTDKQDATDPDPTSDQVRIPQGSLFLELYCPRSPIEQTNSSDDQRSKAAFPRELYRFADESSPSDASDLALDLSIVAPGGVPVWRIAMSEPHPDPALLAGVADASVPPLSNPQEDPWVLRTDKPDTASFEPGNPDELVAGNPITLDRFIWFRHFEDLAAVDALITANNVTDMNDDQVFFAPDAFATNGHARVRPGQFLVLAPRVETAFGSQAFASGAVPTEPSDQHFEIDDPDEGLLHTDPDHNRLTPPLGFDSPNPFAPAKPLVIATFTPEGANWSRVFDENVVGLNISEPMPNQPSPSYYPLPALRYAGNDADYPLEDAYVDLSGPNKTARDTPLDPSRGRIPPDATTPGEPFLGSIPSYCTAYLQRLADPTQPYHVDTNPYRTVDSLPIDLTVFSGEERENKVNNRNSDYIRRSRQRNGQLVDAQGNSVRRDALFSYETSEPETVPLNTTAGTYFEFSGNANFYSSLSFLNTEYPIAGGAGLAVNPAYTDANSNCFSPSIGMLDLVGNTAQNVIGFDRNLPQVPYAQHPWLNRPFATHFELMMVPVCSQGRLFQEFSLPLENANPLVYSEPKEPSAAATAPDNPVSIVRFNGAFRHLFNYFHGDSRDTLGTANERHLKADFSRIFDFVQTLPRFRGEVEMILPARVAGVEDNAEAWLRQLYNPPFNYRYDGLRQGRINLNTLAQFPVWRGLMQGHMTDDEYTNPNSLRQLSFERFLRNRRGYDVPGVGGTLAQGSVVNYDPTRYDPRFPTEFAGVYRPHAEAGLAPRINGANPAAQELLRRRGVDGSYFRHRDPQASPNPTEEPLFVRDVAQQPLPSTTPNTDHSQNRQRDAFIRYQTLMRMPNLAADNSQTYVVWMTIGFFEVDENITNSVPPPSLGREYNEDIGQNQRYQAMFIIDRSKPVGFKPGEDLNARDVVVFEKYFQ